MEKSEEYTTRKIKMNLSSGHCIVDTSPFRLFNFETLHSQVLSKFLLVNLERKKDELHKRSSRRPTCLDGFFDLSKFFLNGIQCW
jgi:hypothetical protein